jgi:hypothetical protein
MSEATSGELDSAVVRLTLRYDFDLTGGLSEEEEAETFVSGTLEVVARDEAPELVLGSAADDAGSSRSFRACKRVMRPVG